MISFDWKKFWEEYPLRYPYDPRATNTRPSAYSYEESVKQDIDRILRFTKKDVVLDYGCGTGEHMILISKMVKDIYGVDNSNTIIEIAKDNHLSFKDKLSTIKEYKTGFKNEFFDKVYSTGVVQYIPYSEFDKFMREMIRITKRGGTILIGDVLEYAPEESGVFPYNSHNWEIYKSWVKDIDFDRSTYENRLQVIIKK